ncbi:MAG TPA: LacI family DNA-binding transcriptional regulator [Humibacter sp.]|nr:LacI family DNA-binding transcriptional regulator [Humibacter sp.]
MNRKPTVYDVAERAGVSIATVSFAFRRPDQIRESTRKAVLAAAHEIGYIPSASARGLARGQTGALGMYSFEMLLGRPQRSEVADAENDILRDLDITDSMIPWDEADEDLLADARAFPLYVDEVQRGFELECKSHGRPLLLTSGSGDEAAIAETAGRVDGLAIFPGSSGAEALERVALNMPVVLFSVPQAEDSHHHVVVDNLGGMRELVSHLVLDHGKARLGFVGGRTVADFSERFDAFRSALTELGIPAPDEVLDDTALGDGRGFGRVIAAVEAEELPDALVCASDQTALAVLDLLAARGVRVPDDVLVTGFDGIFAGRVSRPSLTTVRQPMETMGRVAARLLMEETQSASEAPRVVRLATRLIRRGSCGCGI